MEEIERDEYCYPNKKPNGAMYEIHIKEGYEFRGEKHKYSVSTSKLYGCCSGSGTHADTIEEIKAHFNHMLKGWEEYDSIVQRESDKVTSKNLWFTDKCDTGLTKDILLGNEGLSKWM